MGRISHREMDDALVAGRTLLDLELAMRSRNHKAVNRIRKDADALAIVVLNSCNMLPDTYQRGLANTIEVAGYFHPPVPHSQAIASITIIDAMHRLGEHALSMGRQNPSILFLNREPNLL